MSEKYDLKVLMVCLGNICRSPMADGLLRKKVKENKLNVWVDSAGTGDWHVGNPPDERMRNTAQNNGVPIDDLRARQFKQADFKTFDIIYVMDKSNLKNVLQLAKTKEDKDKVRLLLSNMPSVELQEVPDPYFGGNEGFQMVFDLLDKATDVVVSQLKTNH